MTYFGFLLIFLGLPLLFLGGLVLRAERRGLGLPVALQGLPPYLAILVHMLVALLYTTPWDNYLVATRVWWYDPDRIAGVVLGWVPLEEYAFFILQPLLTGLWLLYLARRLAPAAELPPAPDRLRLIATAGVGLIWFGAIMILLMGWRPGSYLGLILAWLLPPFMLQLGYGADILWTHRRLVLTTILSATLYLGLADLLAIGVGIWTIDPAQSLQIYLASILPLEELIFFLITNILIVCGVVLMLARRSRERLNPGLRRYLARLAPLLFVLWLGALILLPVAKYLWGDAGLTWSVNLNVLLQAALVLALLQQAWGLARTLWAALLIILFSWAIEALGLATGWPFGDYHYTDKLQPQVAQVPLLVPLAWLMMLPPAWAVAGRIANGARTPAFVGLSGLAMTAWDLFLDPQMVAWGFWLWAEPGGYFGIPWLNFAGWFLAAALITAIVQPAELPLGPLLLIYGLTWLLQTLGQLLFWNMPGPALAGFIGMGGCLALAWFNQRYRSHHESLLPHQA
jgi:putative membrane protein